MESIRRTGCLAVLVGLVSHMWIAQTAAYTYKYCANINTASTNANYSIYQSDGLCAGFCPGYSYAILQDSACWCSDYTPASTTTTNLSDCNTGCPGFPSDVCAGNGLYAYLFLDKNPAGTESASPSSTTDAASKSPKTSATITDSSTLTVTAAPDGSGTKASSKGLSTGAIVGIAVGVVFAVAGVAALVVFIWWKKRRERQAEAAADPSPRGSSAGMVSTMASMGEAGTRRGSKLIPIDERMEFNATLYNRGDGNPSSDSVNSLRDDIDYSRRVLRATNPDPSTQP